MADESGIDPRYSAQFQRGFDPARHVDREPAPPAGPTRLPDGPPPTAERVPEPPPLIARPAEIPASERAPDADDLAPLAPSTRRLASAALLGVGILLVALAAGILWVSATDVVFYTSPTTPQDYAILQARNSLPGPLLVAGVLAICAWLAIRALRPRLAL